MRWVAGWHATSESSLPVARPRSGSSVFGETHHIWSANYTNSYVRTFTNQACSVKLAIIGSCLATDTELQAVVSAEGIEILQKVMYFPGSYLAIIHSPTKTLVAGDLAGINRLYVAATTNGYMWSTAATALAALIDSQIEWPLLAFDLAVAEIDSSQYTLPFTGIELVPPGSFLQLDANGIAIGEWYHPRANATYEETAVLFQDALSDSVGRTAQSSQLLSSDFGGTDSSTLIAYASRYSPVHGITYGDPWMTDEDSVFAGQVAQALSGVIHHQVEGGPRQLRYTGLEDESIVTDLPSAGVRVVAQFRIIRDLARKLGSTHHMSGEGGDVVLGMQLSSIVGLYKSGHQIQALEWARRLARRMYKRAGAMMLAVVKSAHSSYATDLRRLAAHIARPERTLSEEDGLMTWWKPGGGVDWLTPQTRAAVSQKLLTMAISEVPFTEPGLLHDWQSIRNIARLMGPLVEEYNEAGIILHMPYCDTRVIDSALSVPGYLRAPIGMFKPLVTRSMAHLLPEAIVGRTTKAGFSRSVQQGIKQNAGYLRHLLIETSYLVDRGVLDRAQVHDAFNRMIHGLDHFLLPLSSFVAIEYWLRHLNLKRHFWWEEF